MKRELQTPKPYHQPLLVQQLHWQMTTGISLPIGTTGFGNDFESQMNDFLTEGEQ